MAPVDVQLLLNPALDLQTMPLQAYYAYATAPPPVAACGMDSSGDRGAEGEEEGAAAGAEARFEQVPGGRVLTMHVHVPEPWLVEVSSPLALYQSK